MQTVPQKVKHILLVGNPNVGKSTIFNLLCNKNQKTGNYAGVTVASHQGTYNFEDEEVEIVDLPGSYSIYPTSEDEAIFTKYLIEEQEKYSGVIYVADALNLKKFVAFSANSGFRNPCSYGGKSNRFGSKKRFKY
jgi:ferrous iron transport protein B